jgi:hypothetical protein
MLPFNITRIFGVIGYLSLVLICIVLSISLGSIIFITLLCLFLLHNIILLIKNLHKKFKINKP